MRRLHYSHPNRNNPDAASTSVVSAGFIPGFERAVCAPDWRHADAVEKLGGDWRVEVSDTAKPNRPNKRAL